MNDHRTDQQLIDATREGDSSAFASLFRRHFTLGRRIVSSIAPGADVDDVVQETFASIYEAISHGAGPRYAFIPYFRTALRNAAIIMANRNRREVPVEDIELALASHHDATTAPKSDSDYLLASAVAFQSLPERWQKVLLFTVVEGMKPSEAAPLMGVTTTGATQLAYRAREGLRQAWLTATIRPSEPSAECSWSATHLGGYARKRSSSRASARLLRHLAACTSCSAAADNVSELAGSVLIERAS